MRFKIRKEVDNNGTWYWTIPVGFFNKLWFVWNPISDLIYIDTQNAWSCWLSQDEAEQHIKRWNSGYYKKKYYKEFVNVAESEGEEK